MHGSVVASSGQPRREESSYSSEWISDRPALHSSQAKISENVQCEIMNVVVEEARASYR
jgi:hypothetical protein